MTPSDTEARMRWNADQMARQADSLVYIAEANDSLSDSQIMSLCTAADMLRDASAAMLRARNEVIEDIEKIIEAQDGMQGWKRRILVTIRQLKDKTDG